MLSKFNFLSTEFWKHNSVTNFDWKWDYFSEVVVLSWSGFEYDTISLWIRLIDDDTRSGFILRLYFSNNDSVKKWDDSFEWRHFLYVIFNEVDRFIILVLIKNANKFQLFLLISLLLIQECSIFYEKIKTYIH